MSRASASTRIDNDQYRLLGLAVIVVSLFLSVSPVAPAADNEPPPGFIALFNGKDLSGWKVPEGDGGHWKVVDGVIDYDAQSEAKGDKSLWLDQEFGDFELHVDWRIKEAPTPTRMSPTSCPTARMPGTSMARS